MNTVHNFIFIINFYVFYSTAGKETCIEKVSQKIDMLPYRDRDTPWVQIGPLRISKRL
jgi:hypothetical protein